MTRRGVLILLRQKSFFSLALTTFILVALSVPVFAVSYNPGVSVGQYSTYGNFVGTGPGYVSFNDYSFLNLQVVSVSGSLVTLLTTDQFKNRTALPGNGTVDVWNLELGTDNGTPSTLGPIIATNLNQGNAIPPPNTYSINQTVDQTYLGVKRSVNILNVAISTSSYNLTQTYIYDKLSGMLLESTSTMITQPQQPITSTLFYSIIATNIFGSTPSPTVPEFSTIAISAVVVLIMLITSSLIILLEKRKKIKTHASIFKKLVSKLNANKTA